MKNLQKEAEFIVKCAETASNLARIDGVRSFPTAENAKSVDDLYVKTRTNFFDFETKKQIILGNYFISKGNYEDYFLKAKKILADGGGHK